MSVHPGSRHEIDKARWPLLSPLLDELLDLDESARAARLAALRAQDLALAQDLAELLARDAAMAQAPMLDSPVLDQLLLATGPVKPGQQLGPYTLEREIGQGGMGTVWLARRTDGRFEGQVAIKFLTAGLLGRGDSGRFAREGQILGRLAHPHIARLLDAGVAQDGGPPYLVLEYIDGLPIDRFCEQQALDVPARVTLFLDVLAAVAHAHNRLILHRDLKPSNILVNQAGEVKLLDFGIAKLLGDATQAERGAAATELTQQAGRAFTPQYAAPEQVQGGDVTTATDVYALGVLLYLLLSGQHPTAGAIGDDVHNSPLARMKAVLEVEPRRLSEQLRTLDARRARELRGDLDTIVAKALKKAPAERYANAEAMASDLRHWLAHEPIQARPDSAGYRIAKFVRRHRVGVAAGAAAALAMSLLTVLSLAQAWRAERAEKLAQQRSAQADDLLGYMLGEFADKLRPIGRLELLNSVGAKAMEHLGQVPVEQLGNPHSTLQRAKALTVLGEVSVSKRDLQAALAPLAAARKLLAGEPPDQSLAADWRKAQGTAAFWQGHAYYTMRQFSEARTAWEGYKASSTEWLRVSLTDNLALIELSYAQTNLGIVMLESGDLANAALQFEASIALKQRALKQQAQDLTLRADAANTRTWLGKALLWQGRLEQAATSYQEALGSIEDIRRRAPADLEWVEREATARLGLAKVWMRMGLDDKAGAELREAQERLRHLLGQEPKNRVWRWLQASVELEQTSLLGRGSAQALAQARRVFDDMTRLSAEASAGAARRWLATRALAGMALSRALIEQSRRVEAAALLRSLLEEMREAEKLQTNDLELRNRMAQMHLMLAMIPPSPPSESPATGQCEQALSELKEVRHVLRLHFEITAAWVQAHSCLAREREVAPEKQWLEERRAAGS